MTKIHDIAISLQATPAARMEGLHSYFNDVPVRLTELIYFIVVVAAVAILLVLLKFGIGLVWKKRGDQEFLSVSNSSGIAAILQELYQTGGQVDFRFTGTDGRPHQGDGTIARMDAQELAIEWLGTSPNTETWIGQKIECYFRTSREKIMRHNLFTVTIKSVTPAGGKRLHIKTPLPEVIESRQKRATLRIMPPEESVLSMAIWGIIGTDLPPSEGKLGDPAMICHENEADQFFLDNISAGGVRIRLPYAKKELFPAPVKNGSVFYFMITLRGHSENENLTYWMLCRVRAARSVPRLESFVLGCQFLAYAQHSEDFPGVLKWKKLENNTEILSLSNWIFKSHLDIYRKKGIDISR